MKRKIPWIIFGVAVLLVGFVLAGAHWRGYFRQLEASRSYQPIVAQVLSRHVETDHGGPREGPTVYHVRITYRYQVDGKSYQGRNVHPPRGIVDSHDEARRLAAQYPEGKVVTAYYNPANPSHSVLDRTAPSLVWPLTMSLFPVLGLALVGLAWR